MEALLMGEDDSSSGESDGEQQRFNVPTGQTAASAVAAARPAPTPAPAPSRVTVVPTNTTTTSTGAAGESQSDQMARLKSLYQQQPKRQPSIPNSGTSIPQASNRSASIAPPPPPQQQQEQQMQQYRQGGPPPHVQQQQQQQHVHARSLPPSRPHPQATPQLQSHLQSLPPPQQLHQQYHRSSSSSGIPGGVADPFAPTPLNHIKERQQLQQQQQQQQHQQKQQQQRQQQQQQRQHTAPPAQQPAYQNAQPLQHEAKVQQQPSRPVDLTSNDRLRELQRQREEANMFSRILMRFLQKTDPNRYRQAELIIKDCAARHKRQEPGFESVTTAVKKRLIALAGDNYSKKAEQYLKHYLDQKKKQQQQQQQQQQGGGVGAVRPSVASGTTSNAVSFVQQQQPVSQENKQKIELIQQQPEQQQQQIQQEQRQQVATPTTLHVHHDIATQKGKGTAAGGKAKNVGKVAAKRKSPSASAASRKAAAAVTTPPAAIASPEVVVNRANPDHLPPREYNDLMQMVDHAIEFDWTTAGLLLGSKMDWQLTDEQNNLLYGESIDTKAEKAEEETLASGVRRGWSSRNIVSARNAWAAVRLRELKQNQQKDVSSRPVVGDTGLTQTSTSVVEGADVATWINEDHAEEDVVLAMLSEGTEIYLRVVLEKAIQCARQRQNLDGIRLWHQQSTYAIKDKNVDREADDKKKHKPPLSLRLGCDVERQQAQVAGNSAMIVKRMEQALERQSGVPARARVLEGETLSQATSMSDLAMRPQLGKGVEMADRHGKRQFEVYGGKDATEPPLGRVPKEAKLEVVDFMMGSLMNEAMGRHYAQNAAASIYF